MFTSTDELIQGDHHIVLHWLTVMLAWQHASDSHVTLHPKHGSRGKYLGEYPLKPRREHLVVSAKGERIEGWGMGGVSPFQPTRWLGEHHELPQRGPGQCPGWKRILAYFEGDRTLLLLMLSVRRKIMSHLGARPRFGEQFPSCPILEPCLFRAI